MATTPISTTNPSATLPMRRWWFSLYPRLSGQGKRGLVVVCLGAAVLAQSIGLMDSPAHSQSPYNNPAVQNALHHLGLPAPDDPIGDQFQVNTYTTSHQRFPAVALDSDGDFVVVWHSNGGSGTDTSGFSIQGQQYNSVGTPQGSQFQVNSYTTNNQLFPAVALDSDGDFVVVWESLGGDGSDPYYSIQGQRYDSAGTPQGSQFQVNSFTTDRQFAPAVSLDSDGDFVVVWMSDTSSGDHSGFSIQGRRYNAAGVPQGNQFRVNSYTTNDQSHPDVALDGDGDFMVVWDSDGSSGGDTSSYSIQGQRYSSAGVPQGSQFQVNSYTTDYQAAPAIALDSDGDFVVVWHSNGSSSGDTSYSSIQGQRYNSAGTAQGAEFQVNSYTTGYQSGPAIALDSDGDFAVVWQSEGSTGDTSGLSVQGQGYNSAGTPQGSEFLVNSYVTGWQDHPAVSLDSNGDFIIVWESDGSSGGDTSSYSIQGQRFGSVWPTPTLTPTSTETPTPSATPTPTSTSTPIERLIYLPAVVSDSTP